MTSSESDHTPPSGDAQRQPTDWTPTDLAQAWARRDPQALPEVVRRYAGGLLGAAMLMLGDRAAADAAVHQTLLLAATRIALLEDPERVRAWLFTILQTQRRAQPAAAPRAVTPAGEDTVGRDCAGLPEPDARMTRRELADLVREAAGALGDLDRELLELHLYGGLGPGDIAVALGIDVRQVTDLLARTRDRMEQAIGGVLIVRLGRSDCAELADLLSGWDGRYTVDIRSRVSRHAIGCSRCRRRWTSSMTFDQLAPAVWPVAPGEGLCAGVASELRTTELAPAAEGTGALPGPRRIPPAAVAAGAAVLLAAVVASALAAGPGPRSVALVTRPIPSADAGRLVGQTSTVSAATPPGTRSGSRASGGSLTLRPPGAAAASSPGTPPDPGAAAAIWVGTRAPARFGSAPSTTVGITAGSASPSTTHRPASTSPPPGSGTGPTLPPPATTPSGPSASSPPIVTQPTGAPLIAPAVMPAPAPPVATTSRNRAGRGTVTTPPTSSATGTTASSTRGRAGSPTNPVPPSRSTAPHGRTGSTSASGS